MADDPNVPDPEQVDESTEATSKLTQQIKDLTKNASLLRQMMSDVNQEIRDNFSELVKTGQITKDVAEDINQYIKFKAQLQDQEKKGIEVTKEQADELKLYHDILVETDPALVEFADSLLEHQKAAEKATLAQKALKGAVKAYSATLSFAGLAQVDFTDGVGSMVTGLATLGAKFDTINKSIQVNTGLGAAGAVQAQALATGTNEYAGTLEEFRDAQTAANASIRQFRTLGGQAQKDLTNQIVGFTRLGASVEASTKAIDLVTNSFNVFKKVSEEAVLPELDKLARELQMPTGKLIEDFVELGPRMARFGQEGRQKFKELSKQARTLGLDINEAFDIAEAVDTFEGAADMAGKLNAQLGTQINSVELLKRDHAGRLSYLRDELSTIADTEEKFKKLERRQRQAIADMLGVDESVAAKFFGEPGALEEYTAAQGEAAERAKELTTIQQKLDVAMEKVMINFQGAALAIAEIAVAISSIGPALAIIGGLIGVAKFLSYIYSLWLLYNKAMAASTVVQGLKIMMNGTEAASNEVLAESQDAVNNRMNHGTERFKSFMKNAKQLIGPLLALGAAAVMLGFGIKLAAEGAALLVTSFQGLGDVAPYAALGLALLMIPFVAFIAAAAIMVYTGVGPAIAGVFLAMGAGALMLGVGIGLAAYGMSLFVNSIKGLGEKEAAAGVAILSALPVIMLAMVPAITILALVGMSAAPALFAIAAASVGIGLGMTMAAHGLSLAIPHLQSLETLNTGALAANLLTLGLAIGFLGLQLIGLAMLLGTGIGAIGFAAAVLALATSFYILSESMSGMGTAASAIASATGGFESLEKVIAVSTKVSSAELDNMERVMSAVVEVSEASKNTAGDGLSRLADSINNMFSGGGGEGSSDKQIVLQVDKHVLGRVMFPEIDGRFKSKYGLKVTK